MRPRDDDGNLLPPPHLRLPETPRLQQAALFALAEDPRACAIPVKRKLTLIDRAIDHVVDGDSEPGWIYGKTDAPPLDNTLLVDLWRRAVVVVREARG